MKTCGEFQTSVILREVCRPKDLAKSLSTFGDRVRVEPRFFKSRHDTENNGLSE